MAFKPGDGTGQNSANPTAQLTTCYGVADAPFKRIVDGFKDLPDKSRAVYNGPTEDDTRMNDNPSASPLDRSLAGKCALITGAAGGIARATAIEFSSRGASLVLTDLDIGALRMIGDATGNAEVLLHEAESDEGS